MNTYSIHFNQLLPRPSSSSSSSSSSWCFKSCIVPILFHQYLYINLHIHTYNYIYVCATHANIYTYIYNIDTYLPPPPPPPPPLSLGHWNHPRRRLSAAPNPTADSSTLPAIRFLPWQTQGPSNSGVGERNLKFELEKRKIQRVDLCWFLWMFQNLGLLVRTAIYFLVWCIPKHLMLCIETIVIVPSHCPSISYRYVKPNCPSPDVASHRFLRIAWHPVILGFQDGL